MNKKQEAFNLFLSLAPGDRVIDNINNYNVLNIYRCKFHQKYKDIRILIVKSKLNPGTNIIMRAE